MTPPREESETPRTYVLGPTVSAEYAHELESALAAALAAKQEAEAKRDLWKYNAEQFEKWWRQQEDYAEKQEDRAEAAERDNAALRAALIAHNDNARSFFQIANRIATELDTHALGTNFGAFAETTHRMLTTYHDITNEARAAIASRQGKPNAE